MVLQSLIELLDHISAVLEVASAVSTETARVAAETQPVPAPPAVLVSFTLDSPADIAGQDWGPWRGLIECESGFQATVENPHSTASGLFQFLDTTWVWTAEHAGRSDLTGMRAKDASVADQYAMAVHLRDMPGGGISHWECDWAYGN